MLISSALVQITRVFCLDSCACTVSTAGCGGSPLILFGFMGFFPIY